MRGNGQRIIQVVAGLLLALETVGSVATADKIRVGKSVTQPFAFAPIEIGVEKGIWGRHGLELQVSIFAGDAKLQQALVNCRAGWDGARMVSRPSPWERSRHSLQRSDEARSTVL